MKHPDMRRTYLTPEARIAQAKRILSITNKSGIRGWDVDRVYIEIRKMCLRDLEGSHEGSS